MVTVAARPGVGKSTAALDFARHTAFKQHETVALFSLEMSAGELWDRIICAESRVRFADYGHRGRLSADDRARIERRLDDLHPYRGNLVIDDDTSATPAQIRARARQIKRKQGLALVIVDYLQLMTPTTRNENRQQEVSELSRQMKLLAKELEVPVLMLSQLNRASEQRADKRPMLADMRESGAIEQDSDIVMLLHRPDSQQRDDARAGEVDLILAKNRGGPTCTITIAHQLHYCRFSDLAIA
ncbi:DnaB-like helicase C-terminal domain-containing protein [Prauserella oleivorans]